MFILILLPKGVVAAVHASALNETKSANAEEQSRVSFIFIISLQKN